MLKMNLPVKFEHLTFSFSSFSPFFGLKTCPFSKSWTWRVSINEPLAVQAMYKEQLYGWAARNFGARFSFSQMVVLSEDNNLLCYTAAVHRNPCIRMNMQKDIYIYAHINSTHTYTSHLLAHT